MAETTETGLPRAVAIAWGMQEVPQRGPNRGLSHARIVAAAVEIADTEGLAAVTMQAVATSLGFTTMSLYRYVSGKDELLRLMQDAAIALPERVTLPADWREALLTWARLIREVYRARPWTLEIPRGQVSVLMPNSVRVADLGLEAMKDLPMDDREKVGIILVASEYVAGVVQLEQHLAAEGAVAPSAAEVEMLGRVITPERFPHLVRVIESGNYPASEGADVAPADDDIDAESELGLQLIVSGVERRIRGESAGGADAAV